MKGGTDADKCSREISRVGRIGMLAVPFYRECTRKVMFEQGPEEVIGIPEGEHGRCKGPEVRAGMARLQSSRAAATARWSHRKR